MRQLCRASTKVVVIQNGVEGAERVAPYAGDAEVLPAVVYCAAELLEPGHIAHRQDGTLILPDTRVGAPVVELFAGTPAVVRATDRYLTDAWRKLGLNVMFNGITALTMRPISVVSRPGVADVARQLLHETWAVAPSRGRRPQRRGRRRADRRVPATSATGARRRCCRTVGPVARPSTTRSTARWCGPGGATASPRRCARSSTRCSPPATPTLAN